MLKIDCLYRNSTKKEKKKENLQINEAKVYQIDAGIHVCLGQDSFYLIFFDSMFFIFIHFFPLVWEVLKKSPQILESHHRVYSRFILYLFSWGVIVLSERWKLC